MSKSFEERTFLNFAGMFFEFEDDFLFHLLCSWTFLYFFKLCTSIRCIEVRKKAVWPGSLFKKTCRRRRPFQTPTQEEGLCMLFKGRTPWSDNACSCYKGQNVFNFENLFPFGDHHGICDWKMKKVWRGKIFCNWESVLTAHIFCSLFKCVKSLKRIALPTMKESSKYFSWNSTFLYLWIKFLQHTQKKYWSMPIVRHWLWQISS